MDKKELGSGRHTALVAEVAWWRMDSGDAAFRRLLPTHDMRIEAILDPLGSTGPTDIDKAIFDGVARGVAEFNATPWAPRDQRVPPPFAPHPALRTAGSRLASRRFNAMRLDPRHEQDMGEIDMLRAAILILSAVSTELERIGTPIWVGWERAHGVQAFKDFQARLGNLALSEKLGGSQAPFPHADLPDLARRMEILDLHAAAEPSHGHSPRHRL